MNEIKILYYVKTERLQYFNKKDVRVASVPIIDENRCSYIVPWHECSYEEAKEFMKRWGKEDYYKKCHRVNKKSLIAKVSNYGCTHRQYFDNLDFLKDYLFLQFNKSKIIEHLRFINDPKLFKELSKTYKIENLVDVDDIIS